MNYDCKITCASESDFDVLIDMVTYQHVHYISQAIEGVLMQKTHFKYHLVILDDCSTDGTSKIIEDYRKRFPDIITTIICKTNSRGQFYSKVMKFYRDVRYITYCEGDDYWTDPYKLEKQISFLNNHPEYIGVTANVRTVDEDGTKQHRDFDFYPFRESHIYSKYNVINMEMASHISALCYRNIFADWSQDDMELYFSVPANGDMKISAILGMEGDIYYSHEVTGDHRRAFKGTSWTAQTHSENRLESMLGMWEKLSVYIERKYSSEINLDGFRNYVRKCGNMNPEDLYRTSPVSWQSYQVRLLDMWMLAHQYGRSISEILYADGIRNVAIYGMSVLGIRLFKELKESRVKVVYGRDRNPSVMFADLHIYTSKPDHSVATEVEAIIVTALKDYDEIERSLLDEGYLKVIALDDMLYQMIPEDDYLIGSALI